MADFYEILGIAKTATAGEVRQAYLRLVRERHPDRFPDAAQKQQAQEFFKHLTEAFNTLSNDKARQQYDAEQAQPKVTAPEEIAAQAYDRGLKMIEARDFHEAVTLLRTAVQNAPNVGRYHAALARALSQNPHWIREAFEELDQAVKLEPRNPGFHFEMAKILAQQGLKLRARRSAETALQLAPGHAAIQQLVNELGGAGEPPEEPPAGGGGLLDRFRRKS
jgi:curved DNA-binding protein CbpA